MGVQNLAGNKSIQDPLKKIESQFQSMIKSQAKTASMIEKLTEMVVKKCVGEAGVKASGGMPQSFGEYIDIFLKPTHKLESPFFNGYNVQDWLQSIEEYFKLCKVSKNLRVDIASLYMRGEASLWFDDYMRSREFVSWSRFSKAVFANFHIESHTVIIDDLNKLEYSGDQETYTNEFEGQEELNSCEIDNCEVDDIVDMQNLDAESNVNIGAPQVFDDMSQRSEDSTSLSEKLNDGLGEFIDVVDSPKSQDLETTPLVPNDYCHAIFIGNEIFIGELETPFVQALPPTPFTSTLQYANPRNPSIVHTNISAHILYSHPSFFSSTTTRNAKAIFPNFHNPPLTPIIPSRSLVSHEEEPHKVISSAKMSEGRDNGLCVSTYSGVNSMSLGERECYENMLVRHVQRSENGLCVYCGGPFSTGHHQKHMGVEFRMREVIEEEEIGNGHVYLVEPVFETGTSFSDTFGDNQLHIMRGIDICKEKPLHTPFDPGATHDFINEQVVMILGYPAENIGFTSDGLVRPWEFCDFILGVQWVVTLRSTNWNLLHGKMKFLFESNKLILIGRGNNVFATVKGALLNKLQMPYKLVCGHPFPIHMPYLLRESSHVLVGRGDVVAICKVDTSFAAIGIYGHGLYVEKWAPFLKELAVMVAKERGSSIFCYLVATDVTHKVVSPLEVVGVFTVEIVTANHNFDVVVSWSVEGPLGNFRLVTRRSTQVTVFDLGGYLIMRQDYGLSGMGQLAEVEATEVILERVLVKRKHAVVGTIVGQVGGCLS